MPRLILVLLGLIAALSPSQAIAQGSSSHPATPAPPEQASGQPAPPLTMQADQLIYDAKNKRVIARGSVEMLYNNYILTADQVVYDRTTNKLIAEGNAQLKNPDGRITKAERFEATDDFRDAFAASIDLPGR
jgi:LPS-assembly protein